MKNAIKDSWVINPNTTISPQIHRILRERIIQNDLPSGSKISEPEISRIYSISRQPVREAFIKLSEEGLVKVMPQRGTLIRKIDYHAVLDAQFLREAIEADIVKILCKNQNLSLITELKLQIKEQEKTAKKDTTDFILLDELFHRTLADAASKTRAWSFIEGLKSQMDRVRFLSFGRFPTDKLVSQHKAIVNSIEKGNAGVAENAMRKHLREILKTLPELLKIHREFFED